MQRDFAYCTSKSNAADRKIVIGLSLLGLGLLLPVLGCGAVGPGDRPTLGGVIIADPAPISDGDSVIDPADVDPAEIEMVVEPVFCCNPLSLNFSATITPLKLQSGATFEWDFGDNRGGTGAALLHTYGIPGTYQTQLTVRLSTGEVLQARRVLSLAIDDGVPAVVVTDPEGLPGEDEEDPSESVLFTLDAGPEMSVESGDRVVLSPIVTGALASELSWSWTQIFGPSVTLSLANSPSPSFTAPVLEDAVQKFTFRATVSNGTQIAFDDVVVSVAPIRIPGTSGPTVSNLSVSVDQRSFVTIQLAGSSGNGSDLTFEIFTPPTHGTLSAINNTPRESATLMYTPYPSYSGTDSFKFRARSGTLVSPIAACAITVRPEAPEVTIPSGPETVFFLSGPKGTAAPGPAEVTWRFAAGVTPVDVTLRRDCCQCGDTLTQVLRPDVQGVYRAVVDVPADRTIWYHVFYTVAGERFMSQSIYVNPPTGPATAPPPVVIWYHLRMVDPSVIETVIDSGVITHVMIGGADRTALAHDDPEVLEVIAMCRAAGLKVIWSRHLWGNFVTYQDLADAYDPDFYATAVAQVLSEAAELGVDGTALDCEAYSNSPLDHWFDQDLSQTEFDIVGQAIRQASMSGKVDYVYPAGTHGRPMRVTNLFADLGYNRVATSTYWDVPHKNCQITYAYDVFSAFVQARTDRPGSGLAPYFLPYDILERRYLWSQADGAPGMVNALFLYPGIDPATVPGVADLLPQE